MYTYDRHSLNKKSTTAQHRGSSWAKPDRRSPQAAKAEAPVSRVPDPEGAGGDGSHPREIRAPWGPGAKQPPATCKRRRREDAGGLPGSAGRTRLAGRDLLPQFPLPPAPQPGRPSGLTPRRPAPGTRAGLRRAISPQPSRHRRVRPHLTATRTELSSGVPHMLAAGDGRAPGLLHRRAEAPPEPRSSGAGDWSSRGRPAHLRRAPAMLGD